VTANPCVVVAVHDGFYGAGTGAGYANRGFLKTLISLMSPEVHLVVLPIFLDRDSPEYQASWHEDSVELCLRAGATVLPVDNGTGGQVRFGGIDAFTRAARSTAAALSEEVLPNADPLAVVAFDVPFLGAVARLPSEIVPRFAMVPRSTGLLHDPTNGDRIRYERDGLSLLAAGGGRIVPISGYMRSHLKHDYGLPEVSLLDMPDGLAADEWHYEPPRQPVLPPDARGGFVLAYGRAQPYKGWDDLIDALSLLRTDGIEVPHAVLAAVTDQEMPSEYQNHLAGRIHALGLNATLVTRFDPAIRGLLAHPELRAVVVASRAEPFGRVPLEAYAAGAGPVVVTTAGGLREQVVDGVTGFTAEPADPVSLAAAIARAVCLSEEDRRQMRQSGLELARSRFDHRDSVQRFFAKFAPWVCRIASFDERAVS
jgi:glycosyltransferase involved in cell wall biosynthesis